MKSRKAVQKIFSEVPPTYDAINHLITFGMDILWRKKLAGMATRIPGKRILDVCCGTGELLAMLHRCDPSNPSIFGLDQSASMLAVARAKKRDPGATFIQSDAAKLPFRDTSLDIITLSFASRNLRLSDGVFDGILGELYRVLVPGGQLLHLETSQPGPAAIRRLLKAYLRYWVKPAGSTISGSKAGYAYLAGTIPTFYNPEQLTGRIQTAGFSQITVQKLLWGIAAIHCAVK